MQLAIDSNFPEIARRLDRLAEDIASKAMASAVNKTIDQARTQMVREITSEYALKASEVRDRLRITRASFRQGTLNITASLSAATGRRSINLIRFVESKVSMAEMRRRHKAEGARPQLRFRIKKGGALQTIPGAFIATANGGTFVAQRVGKAAYPIKAIQTIGVPQMFNSRRIKGAVIRAMETRFPEIADREIRYFLSNYKPA